MCEYSVWCCGSNGSGQLGLGDTDDRNESEVCFKTKYRPVGIGCGGNHTVLLLENGEVYVTGDNMDRLVNFESNKDSLLLFKKIDNKDHHHIANFKFKHVGAGWGYTVLVTTDNRIFMYGDTSIGGLGRSIKNAYHLTEVICNDDTKDKDNDIDNDDIVFVSTALYGVIVGYASGKVIGWGDNSKGQLLGDCGENGRLWDPTIVHFIDIPNGENMKIVECAMGREYTIFRLKYIADGSEIVLMRGKKDRFDILEKLNMLIGDDDSGVVGEIGVNRSRWFRVRDNVVIKHIKSMWGSVHVMYEEKVKGENVGMVIRSVGNDTQNQVFPLECLIPMATFNTGSAHGVCVSKNRDIVYAWGWGEHGNCGKETNDSEHFDDSRVMHAVYKDHTENKGDIIDVFVGYATTWVVVCK